MRLIAFSRAPAFIAAQERGLFAAEGLAVEFAPAASSAMQLDGLLAGEWDVAHTAADNVVSRIDAGADLRIVLVATLGIDHRLVGAPFVRKALDLDGRRLGVDATGTGYAVVAYALLAQAGLPRERYRVLSLGGSRERFAALIAGRVEAAMLNRAFDERALAQGCNVLADPSQRFPQLPGLTVAVRGAWAAAHGDEVIGYCRALIAGARASGATVPSIGEMAHAIQAARSLRQSVGLATKDDSGNADRYFDPSFARAADPALASG